MKLSSLGTRRRGAQALVEFTLVVPILFLLLLGILDFGRVGFYYVASAGLARTAARYGAAYNDGIGFTNAQMVAYVKQQSDAATMGSLTQPAACGTSTPPSPLTACYQPPVGQTYIFIDRSNFSTIPKFIKVSIIYHFEPTTPMIRAIFPTYYLVSTASMETEF